MPKFEGVETLTRKLKGLLEKSKKGSAFEVVVGYGARYSVFVHENMTAHHTVGMAKFLEQPMRQNRQRYGEVAARLIKQKKSVKDALLETGLQLQFDSQALCPVDTGQLRLSAFVQVVPKE